MFTADSCNSWYNGANIEGKARVFLPYVGGLPVHGSLQRGCRARLRGIRPSLSSGARRPLHHHLSFRRAISASGAIERIELRHVVHGQREVEYLPVLGDAFAVRRLGEHDQIVLHTQRSKTCAGVRPLRDAMALTTLCERWRPVPRGLYASVTMSTVACVLYERTSVFEWTDLYLVHDRSNLGHRCQRVQLGNTEVRDTDRSR